jgi:hypothetical protein
MSALCSPPGMKMAAPRARIFIEKTKVNLYAPARIVPAHCYVKRWTVLFFKKVSHLDFLGIMEIIIFEQKNYMNERVNFP